MMTRLVVALSTITTASLAVARRSPTRQRRLHRPHAEARLAGAGIAPVAGKVIGVSAAGSFWELSPACGSQMSEGMRPIDPVRWDDYVLVLLLLIIGVPRVVLAVMYDRSLGVEGTLSMICVALALLLLFRRNR